MAHRHLRGITSMCARSTIYPDKKHFPSDAVRKYFRNEKMENYCMSCLGMQLLCVLCANVHVTCVSVTLRNVTAESDSGMTPAITQWRMNCERELTKGRLGAWLCAVIRTRAPLCLTARGLLFVYVSLVNYCFVQSVCFLEH